MKKITIIEPTPPSEKIDNRPKMRVAAYARVSTEEDEQKNSLAAQREHFEALFASHPEWINAGIYYDEGITGTSMKKRDGFNHLIDDAMSGKIDRILVKSISRFARNTVDTLLIIRKLKAIGVAVYFEKENMDSMDLKSEFVLTIMSSLAQEESISISENVKWGMRQSYAKGQVNVPYSRLLGYKGKPGEKCVLVIDKEQAKTVRLIYRLFLEGHSGYAIAQFLIKNKVPSVCNGVWEPETILSILSNEKYCGDAILQKTFTLDAITKKHYINNGYLPKYFIEGNHPAIIKKATWLEVQERLEYRRQISRARKYPLSGKIVCDVCHAFYFRRGRPHRYSGKNVPIWRCSSVKKKACGNVTVYDEPLHELCRKALLWLIRKYLFVKEDVSSILSKILPTGRSIGPASIRFFESTIDNETEELFSRLFIRTVTVYPDRSIDIAFIDGSVYNGKAPRGLKKNKL